MSKVESIRQAIEKLSKRERNALRKWFDEQDAAAWDRQIEADVKAGRLDKLFDAAIADRKAGRTTKL